MIWSVDPVFFTLFGVDIKYYSLCWLLAFICGYSITSKITQKMQWEEGLLDKFLTYMLIGTALGARLGHCLFYDFSYYSHHVLEIFLPIKITDTGIFFHGFAGLASHGASIGILISTYLFCKKYNKKWIEVLDLLGIAVPVGGAMIRLGNFFNSEILGKATTSSFGIVFSLYDNVSRHPAQLYEAFGYLVIAVCCYMFFYFFFKNNAYTKKSGFITGFYVTMIFTLRFLIEFVKESQGGFDDVVVNAVGLNLGQLLSIPFVLIFSILMFKSFKRV